MRLAGKSLEARMREGVCFPFVSPGIMMKEGETQME